MHQVLHLIGFSVNKLPKIPCLVKHADDALAILAAFNSPEVEVVGMTTIYGNVPTSKATQNAVRLRELAGQEQVVMTASTYRHTVVMVINAA